MINELCTSFVDGVLDEELVQIEVVKAGTVLLKSSYGRLFMSPANKLTLHVHAPSIPGNFPTKDYGEFNGLQVVGTTRSGWKLKTFVFLLKPLSYIPEEDMAVWSMEPFEVELQRYVPDQAQGAPSYAALIDRLDCLFELGSTRISPEGKGSLMALDWLQVETQSASIQLYRGDAKWSRLRLEAQQQVTPADLCGEVKLFLDALSVRMGRRIDAVATTIRHGHVEAVQLAAYHLSRLKHSGDTPVVPLVLRNGLGSAFLKASIEYFRTHDQSPLLDYLYSVWDGELISRENHRLQLAIALEGLSKYVNQLPPGASCTQTELKRRAEEKQFSKLKDEALVLIDTMKGDEGHLNRLKNVIKRASLNDASPMIKSAGESLGITFGEEELKCWKSMRHGPAHGDLSKFDETESDFWACLSMLYRMTLSLIGWSGPVMPYGNYAKYVRRDDESERPVQVINLSSIKEIRRVED